jgi:hypothetical protein
MRSIVDQNVFQEGALATLTGRISSHAGGKNV